MLLSILASKGTVKAKRSAPSLLADHFREVRRDGRSADEWRTRLPWILGGRTRSEIGARCANLNGFLYSIAGRVEVPSMPMRRFVVTRFDRFSGGCIWGLDPAGGLGRSRDQRGSGSGI